MKAKYKEGQTINYQSGDMHANYHEVMDYRWVNKKQLQEDVLVNPCEYTYWFKDPL